MKKFVLSGLMLFGIANAYPVYFINNQINYGASYYKMEKEMAGIDIIPQGIQIQKMYLGETNPVVINAISKKVERYFDKKFETLNKKINKTLNYLSSLIKKEQKRNNAFLETKLKNFQKQLKKMKHKIYLLALDDKLNSTNYKIFYTKYNLILKRLNTLYIYLNKQGYILNPVVYKAYEKNLKKVLGDNCNCKKNPKIPILQKPIQSIIPQTSKPTTPHPSSNIPNFIQ